MLLTTFDFGPGKKPISWEPLLLADRAVANLWQGAIVNPGIVYGQGGPFYEVIQAVSSYRVLDVVTWILKR